MLAAAIEAPAGATLLEAGCGAGAALIAAATGLAEVRFIGLERDAGALALARENVRLNALEHRVEIVEGDALAAGAPFDGVFTNPPFDAEGAPEPHPARRASYVSDAGVAEWIKALSNRLRGGARLTMIQRALHLPAILAALEGRLGGIEVLPIRPSGDQPAKRVLVRAAKGSRAPLRLLKGLDLHDDSGAKFTAEADAIFKGAARIVWR